LRVLFSLSFSFFIKQKAHTDPGTFIGRGEAEEKLPKKCKENGWMDFATTIGEHFLNGGGSKEDGLVNMGGGSEVDNGEEYESDGEEED
jgi:hypothetical protein